MKRKISCFSRKSIIKKFNFFCLILSISLLCLNPANAQFKMVANGAKNAAKAYAVYKIIKTGKNVADLSKKVLPFAKNARDNLPVLKALVQKHPDAIPFIMGSLATCKASGNCKIPKKELSDALDNIKLALDDLDISIPDYGEAIPLPELPGYENNKVDVEVEGFLETEPIDNIITTPSGIQIDTSTEFPIEKPQSWEEYLLLKNNSQKLADNMYKHGMGLKSNGYAAHHIIPATDKKAKIARDILSLYGIDINDAINGVYLPTYRDKTSTQGIEHNGRHPESYSEKISILIEDAHNIGGKNGVLNKLKDIKNKLENAQRNSDWRKIL